MKGKNGGAPFYVAVEEFRRHLIVAALAAHGGRRGAAARALGLPRTYFARLMREMGLQDRPQPAMLVARRSYTDARGAAPSLNGLSPEAAIRRGRG